MNNFSSKLRQIGIWLITLFVFWGCSQPIEPSLTSTMTESSIPSSTPISANDSTPISTSTMTITVQPLNPSPTQTKQYTPTKYVFPPLSGNMAVVLTEDDGTDDIYIVNITEPVDMYPLTTEGRFNQYPDWSPSGEEIAFSSNRGEYGSGDFAIYVTSVKGGDAKQLTSDRRIQETQPTWSPDGKSIAFAMLINQDGGSNWDIFIMDPNGNNQTQITNTTSHDGQPSWSPMNDVIAFLSRDSAESKNAYVYSMRTDGSSRREVSDLPAFGPITWSPDGSKMAFSVKNGSSIDIYVINKDGSDGYFLTNEANYDNFYPTWSPDGMYIAFSSSNGDYKDIYIVDVYGTLINKISLDLEFYTIRYLDWSPQ